MCQPSANNAIEPNAVPAAISPSIIATVRPITKRVRDSWVAWVAPRNRCSGCHGVRSWVCFGYSLARRWGVGQLSTDRGHLATQYRTAGPVATRVNVPYQQRGAVHEQQRGERRGDHGEERIARQPACRDG